MIYELRITNYELRAASYELRITSYGGMTPIASTQMTQESYHAFTGYRDEVDATRPPSR